MLTITPDQARELPVDNLGLRVLADMKGIDEWNEYNYALLYAQAPEWRDTAPVIGAQRPSGSSR